MRMLVVVALLGGCYSPAYRDCEIRCSEGTCPSGYECRAGMCRPESTSGLCGAGSDDARPIDIMAMPDAPYPTGMWGAPTEIQFPGGPPDLGDPGLPEDELELYVNLSGDIYRATRATTSASWSQLAVVQNINNPTAEEQTPTLSPDGLTIYFASNRPGGAGDQDLYMATRATRSAPWSPPAPLSVFNSPAGDNNLSVSYDGLTAVFSSNRVATAGTDLYISTRTSTGVAWGTPQLITELQTNAGEAHACISPDTLTLYFHRAVATLDDLYVAKRQSTTLPFVEAPITELNTQDYDSDPWVSPDGHTMYFASNRLGSTGNRIYRATR